MERQPVSTASQATAAAMPSMTRTPTTFLSLPAEIRNEIYHLSGCLRLYEKCERHRSMWRWTPLSALVFSGDRGPDFREPENRGDPRYKKCGCYVRYGQTLEHGDKCDKSPQNAYFIINRDKAAEGFKVPPRHERPVFIQPNLTKVSRQVRSDTLPMFYGNVLFVARLFTPLSSKKGWNETMVDENIDDANRVLEYLDMIGPVNASCIRELHIVYTRNKMRKYIERNFRPELRRRGIGSDASITLHKMGYDYNGSRSDREVLFFLDKELGRTMGPERNWHPNTNVPNAHKQSEPCHQGRDERQWRSHFRRRVSQNESATDDRSNSTSSVRYLSAYTRRSVRGGSNDSDHI